LSVLESEFFWGVIVGAVLAALGSWLIVWLQERAQQRYRNKTVRSFSIDTVENVLQIIRDLQKLRGRPNAIQYDFLALLEVEIGVFGRNREQIILLAPEPRRKLREFMNNCAIKKAEISNWLTQFYQQVTLADQLTASDQGLESQRVRDAAAGGPLARANAAADQLFQLVPDGEKILALLQD
jgi:hypothetical protein